MLFQLDVLEFLSQSAKTLQWVMLRLAGNVETRASLLFNKD